ncbi:MAG TPA: phosphoadenylyl-sulfate reductase [Burkholderiales bacterium]|nr:phosphoadenylyl-sulfate reductase [Burkholderiales bacterium]
MITRNDPQLSVEARAVPERKAESVKALLSKIEKDFAPATFASSFGAEDMVLLDLIVRFAPGIEIFTLDTGRLPEETYALMNKIAERYGVKVRVYFPQAKAVEQYVQQHGPNAFYESVELRKACCHMRKVEPLKRTLVGKKAWVTGMRRGQSVTRGVTPESEFDKDHGLHKFNPLYDWTEKEVWAYIRANNVPYNALHDKGYASIGCAPCTRAITPGEDIRAGRWWWEDAKNKECGLHRKSEAV